MKRFCLVIVLLSLAACARPIPPQDPEAVSRIWSVLHPRAESSDRITARFSLNVESKDRTGRLTGQIWGLPTSVMRMDLASGTGASVAMIRETADLWLAYIPSENKAYHHAQAKAGLALFQIPVPFDAKQISSLFLGNAAPILGGEYSRVEQLRNGALRFSFAHGDVSHLDVLPDMSTLFFQGRKGWTLLCERPYSSPVFPDHQLYDKFTFTSPRDGRAVLRIKSLEPGGAWLTTDLDLTLPEDTQWMRIIPSSDYN